MTCLPTLVVVNVEAARSHFFIGFPLLGENGQFRVPSNGLAAVLLMQPDILSSTNKM